MSTFYTTHDDGFLVRSHTVYATAHDSAIGTPNLTSLDVGQHFSSPNYRIMRGFIFFDTSTIGAGAEIISATLTLYTISKAYADTAFDIIIRNGMPDHPEEPIAVGDFLYSQYSGDGGSINSADCSGVEFAPNIITLNETGRGWINKTGTTKFALISSRDIDSDIPDGEEYMSFEERSVAGGTDYVAKLIVNFFTPTEIPTVTTINLECEDRQATTLTAVGEITGTGDGYTFRGFEYYQYGEGEYDSSMWAVREIGRFHTLGEFRMTLYGLKPSTIYWIRAFAGNIFGIGYGDWILCSTTAVLTHTYDIYEEDNSGPDSDGTYAGGNTVSFYVRKVGGKWSKKYGPYHSDQVDIAVSDVMIEGTGKYQVKFESGVLTGISTQVMCKLDIKAR